MSVASSPIACCLFNNVASELLHSHLPPLEGVAFTLTVPFNTLLALTCAAVQEAQGAHQDCNRPGIPQLRDSPRDWRAVIRVQERVPVGHTPGRLQGLR